MNFFKKLFNKCKKKDAKADECWYNNSHEKKRRRWSEPIEGEALSGPHQMDHAICNQMSKRQN